LVAGFSVVALGALLLFVDYALMAAHSAPPFCSSPSCSTISKFLDISAASFLAALICAVLAAYLRPRAFPTAGLGAVVVSVVAGFVSGVELWYFPNVVVGFLLAIVLLVLWSEP
jgi:hypothetical protein